MKSKPTMPDYEKINRRELMGKLGLFTGAGLLTEEEFGVSAGLFPKDQNDIKQTEFLKQAKKLKYVSQGDITLTFMNQGLVGQLFREGMFWIY